MTAHKVATLRARPLGLQSTQRAHHTVRSSLFVGEERLPFISLRIDLSSLQTGFGKNLAFTVQPMVCRLVHDLTVIGE